MIADAVLFCLFAALLLKCRKSAKRPRADLYGYWLAVLVVLAMASPADARLRSRNQSSFQPAQSRREAAPTQWPQVSSSGGRVAFPARQPGGHSHSVAGLSSGEQRMVAAVNEYRSRFNLAELVVDQTLMGVARRAAPYFNHCINGQWCWTRAHAAGFPGWATDDIADGYESPEDAVGGWASSDGHAHQMRGDFNMNGQWRNYRFNRIGVGISGRKYIAVFGRSEE
jgi:uncharacterized protein YkwD